MQTNMNKNQQEKKELFLPLLCVVFVFLHLCDKSVTRNDSRQVQTELKMIVIMFK